MAQFVPSALPMLRQQIGYARSSSQEEANESQVTALRAAGCRLVHEERVVAGSQYRPVLSKLLHDIRPGDVVVVVGLDRIALSVSHLLDVLTELEKRGAHFRSLDGAINTTATQGFTCVPVLRAVLHLERTLKTERARNGIKTARERGKLPGNPGLRERRSEAIELAAAARRRGYISNLMGSASNWLPVVRRMRPQHSWQDVVRVLNDDQEQNWTVEKLRRAVHRLVSEKVAEPTLLDRSPRRPPEDRLMALVTGIALSNPELSLRDIAQQLDRMGQRPPRGGRHWATSSVKALLDRASRLGLVVPDPE